MAGESSVSGWRVQCQWMMSPVAVDGESSYG